MNFDRRSLFSEAFTEVGLLTREDAIRAFGVVYLCSGPGRPIVEMLGRHRSDPDPVSARSVFPDEWEAIEYARASYASRLEREILRIANSLDTSRVRVALWLARNWRFARKRSTGILATEAVLADLRMRRDLISTGRWSPIVDRLPPVLRLPRVLDIEATVYVVDFAGFPETRVVMRIDRIWRRTIVVPEIHPTYDVLVRYEMRETPGVYSYDSVDVFSGRLEGGSDLDIYVFVSEAAARDEMQKLAGYLRKMIESPAGAIAVDALVPSRDDGEVSTTNLLDTEIESRIFTPSSSTPSHGEDEIELAVEALVLETWAPSPRGLSDVLDSAESYFSRPWSLNSPEIAEVPLTRAFLSRDHDVFVPPDIPAAKSLSARLDRWLSHQVVS